MALYILSPVISGRAIFGDTVHALISVKAIRLLQLSVHPLPFGTDSTARVQRAEILNDTSFNDFANWSLVWYK